MTTAAYQIAATASVVVFILLETKFFFCSYTVETQE
jgi:hypothetical protein